MSTSTEHTIISINPIPTRTQIITSKRQSKFTIACNKCSIWFFDLPIVIKIIIISLIILLIALITFILYFGVSLTKIFS